MAVLLLSEMGLNRFPAGRIVRLPSGPAGVRIGRTSGQEISEGGDPATGIPASPGGEAEVRLRDPSLSRAHLRIVQRGAGFSVMDEGSLNGTFLDGRVVDRPMRLSPGSILCFGRHAGVFRLTTERALAAIEEEGRWALGPVATLSPALAEGLALLRRRSRTDDNLLVLGETGVGKEVYARALHETMGRSGPFLALNCAAMPDELVEKELFGAAPGVGAGTFKGSPGLIAAAEKGTLFLDELGDASPALQAKLLRFLEDREVRPLGATAGRRVDVKIIAATHSLDVEDRTHSRLRPDLVRRFGAEPTTIPALRHRMEDLAALVAHFSASVKAAPIFQSIAQRALYCHGWPGNVREIKNVINHALTRAEGERIELEHLPAAVRDASRRGPPIEAITRRQRAAPSPEELRTLLAQHDGNVAAVARALDRQWTVVWRWAMKHDLVRTRRAAPR